MSKIKIALKRLIYSNAALYKLYQASNGVLKKVHTSRCVKIENQGIALIRKDIEGTGHLVQIGRGGVLQNVTVRMRGENNSLIIGENCNIGTDCSFWLEGSNLQIIVGSGTTMTCKVHINAQEHGNKIIIGTDCMLSNTIIIRTSDSHPIYDKNSKERLNGAKDINIGNHVWIAPNSKVMKGVHIGDGSIIGSDSMVTKDIPENVLAVGHPAKVVKTNIEWTRESLF